LSSKRGGRRCDWADGDGSWQRGCHAPSKLKNSPFSTPMRGGTKIARFGSQVFDLSGSKSKDQTQSSYSLKGTIHENTFM
jgi:hypothetical protein